MGDIEALTADLESARASLLEALEGLTEDEFAAEVDGRSIRETLWRVGLEEDWARRAVSKASAGHTPDAFRPLQRPGVTNTLGHLVAWLEQCRRPTLALLKRLTEHDLDREFALPDGEARTARGLLEQIAQRDREHAAEIGARRGAATTG